MVLLALANKKQKTDSHSIVCAQTITIPFTSLFVSAYIELFINVVLCVTEFSDLSL